MENVLKEKRLKLGYTMHELSAVTGIDQALLSKYEGGKREPSDKHIIALSTGLDIPLPQLKRVFLAEKLAKLVRYEPNFREILALAESRAEYLSSPKVLQPIEVNKEVSNRLKKIDELKAIWASKKPLNKTQLQKMQEYFNVKYTFDSNQIEGNTLTYQETNLVINEGLTISGKSMREHLEAINHADAIEFVNELVLGNEDITRRTLLEIHRLILKSIDRENAGRYRSVPVMISGSKHVPPEPYLIDKLMEDYFLNYLNQKKAIHPVIVAAEMHERLVSIHPFVDGNGRTSRLIMNFILLKNGYTVTSLKGDYESRMEYYRVLERVQVNNDPNDFYHLILDRLTESLEEHIKLAG